MSSGTTTYTEASTFGTDSVRKIDKLVNEAVNGGTVGVNANSITKVFSKTIGFTDIGVAINKLKVFSMIRVGSEQPSRYKQEHESYIDCIDKFGAGR